MISSFNLMSLCFLFDFIMIDDKQTPYNVNMKLIFIMQYELKIVCYIYYKFNTLKPIKTSMIL